MGLDLGWAGVPQRIEGGMSDRYALPVTGECPQLVTGVVMTTQGRVEPPPVVAYESSRVTLWHGDARRVLPTLATESHDLVVTDPPYGVEFQSGFREGTFDVIHNDAAADRDGVHEVLRECVRLVGQNRHLYVFGPSDVLNGLKVGETADLVWDKNIIGAGNLTAPWGPAHEPITFAVSKHRHAGQTGAGSPAVRMRKGSVLRFTRPTGRKVRHPNEKPVALLRELIESSTRAGDLVLDPFGGSGSTAVAAVLGGRRAVLVESDEQWIPLAVERISAAERLADQIEEAS
jgi:DNA modification methylase